MKKNKTSLGISYLSSSSLMESEDGEIQALERQSKVMDDNILMKKNTLLKK